MLLMFLMSAERIVTIVLARPVPTWLALSGIGGALLTAFLTMILHSYLWWTAPVVSATGFASIFFHVIVLGDVGFTVAHGTRLYCYSAALGTPVALLDLLFIGADGVAIVLAYALIVTRLKSLHVATQSKELEALDAESGLAIVSTAKASIVRLGSNSTGSPVSILDSAALSPSAGSPRGRRTNRNIQSRPLNFQYTAGPACNPRWHDLRHKRARRQPRVCAHFAQIFYRVHGSADFTVLGSSVPERGRGYVLLVGADGGSGPTPLFSPLLSLLLLVADVTGGEMGRSQSRGGGARVSDMVLGGSDGDTGITGGGGGMSIKGGDVGTGIEGGEGDPDNENELRDSERDCQIPRDAVATPLASVARTRLGRKSSFEWRELMGADDRVRGKDPGWLFLGRVGEHLQN
ncbi:hypothetical protein BC828DRAFT_401380 [Blastocladiella britannica]|nr:hypothetical protein BC828DRAFT_401380 [Blastocladiella britannica]